MSLAYKVKKFEFRRAAFGETFFIFVYPENFMCLA